MAISASDDDGTQGERKKPNPRVLFWTTICTIVASVVAGVLVYHLTERGGKGGSNGPATPIELTKYQEDHGVFEINYPLAMGGIELTDATVDESGRLVYSTDATSSKLGLASAQIVGDFHPITVMIMPATKKNWVDAEQIRTVWTRPMKGYRAKVVGTGHSEDRSTLYYEVRHDYRALGIWTTNTTYRIIRLDKRDGFLLVATAQLQPKLWEKLRGAMRESFLGIKWSPEAARGALSKRREPEIDPNERP